MLQVAFIRQNREEVIKKLLKKNFDKTDVVDTIISLDNTRKRLQAEIDELQSKINATSKEIGQLMARKDVGTANEKKAAITEFKNAMQPLEAEMKDAELLLNTNILTLPNLPHEKVPDGKTPAENVVEREGGKKPQLGKDAMAHWDLAKKYDLIDFELGNKVTGSGFPFYKNKGAKLQRSLINYFLNYNTQRGYTEYQAPLMVNESSAYGTGQLPDKEGQMYHITEDNFYMIPTSEVPLTNIYRDEILKESVLPIKLTGYTPCFRREAGSYGKDVRGLNRLHQFDKVEIVQLVHPDTSYEVLEQMVTHIEELLVSLGLPYRILKLCGGDLGFTSAFTYDFEVYSAAQEKWLEVSSVSNFETYQSNRLKARFKNQDGKNLLVHTLNGSSLALPRIVAALLENNQTPEGIRLPKVLHPYFGNNMIN